ncbi:helix-turn-helix domain-containing protein [Listeria booriae]|uniref:Helix-turn-helix domain-containing protein n=1 Tax=Listeria booriae TaxID=1552123 RepID=A0A841YA42_9LIST|nr:Rgg/GadR/MutR family transcriptional regulator [Listeria booriae]MBC1373787.1 helix-turn-helix domain-containing protein [Listeria booriae]
MKTLGETLKYIRTSKGLKQENLATNIISRANYQKIEYDKVIPSYDRYIDILNTLNIEFEELGYIQHDFEPSKRMEIIYGFDNLLSSAQQEAMGILNKKCEDYLEKQNDQYISDIHCTLKAIIKLENTNDFNLAKPFVSHIWDRLEPQNEWFIQDIRILANIFYLFPNYTAKNIVERLLIHLKKYKYYKTSTKLELALKINMATFLILDNDLSSALKYIESANIQATEARNYRSMSVCTLKKGIIISKEGNQKEGMKLIKKSIQMVEIFDDQLMINSYKNEVKDLLQLNI